MKHYLVSPGKKLGAYDNDGSKPWFNKSRIGYGSSWQNYVRCKTKAHALRQFGRCSKGAQIDVRGDGKPYVWRVK